MECMFCKGKMERGTAPFHIDRNGYHVIFDHLPAWVCTQCGEPYYEEGDVDTIQDLIRSIDRKAQDLKLTA